MDVRASRLGTVAVVAAAAIFATACGGSGASGRLAVSARAVPPAAAAAAPAGASGLDLGSGIALTRVRLAVQRIALESQSSTSAQDASATSAKESGSGGGDGGGSGGGGADDAGGEDEVVVGPFAVDLGADALAGGIQPIFDADVPAGTYREVRIVVAPVAGSALAGLDGHSVIVDGTIDGAPFTFASALSSAQKIELTVQVAADGSSSGVVLTVDPQGWFRAADGSRLDPTVDANRMAIEAAIRASIGVEREDEVRGGGADDPAPHA